jgi:hypothetical protein
MRLAITGLGTKDGIRAKSRATVLGAAGDRRVQVGPFRVGHWSASLGNLSRVRGNRRIDIRFTTGIESGRLMSCTWCRPADGGCIGRAIPLSRGYLPLLASASPRP